jgi:hypothetical protein
MLVRDANEPSSRLLGVVPRKHEILASQGCSLTSGLERAVMQLHQTYDFPGHVKIAQATWVTGKSYTLTIENVVAKRSLMKNIPFAEQCQSGKIGVCPC